MTDIVPAPDVALSSQFPTNADRVAGVFNAKTAAWADSSRTMAADMDEAAKSAQINAVAAHERALAAQQARDEVLPAAQQVGEDAEKVAADRTAVEQYVLEGPVLSIGGFTGAVPMKTVNGLPIVGATGNIDVGIVKHSQRTTNAEITKDQRGHLIDVSGTFAQTFSAAALLNDGWWCYLRNSGQGDIVLTPASGELIDELASYVMYPGECRLIQCDGSVLRSVVLNSFYKVFESSGTFTKPPGYRLFEGLLWGGGSSGAKGDSNTIFSNIAGGAGGACTPFNLPSAIVSALENFVIGAGGIAVSNDGGGSGNTGGTSTFGALVTAFGGGVADRGSANVLGTTGGRAELSAGGYLGASISISGALTATFYGGGAGQYVPTSGAVSAVKTTVFGGAGGGSARSSGLVPPTTTVFGGAGGAAANGVDAAAGGAPGGGGGAQWSGTAGVISGAGARGELRIWGII